MTRGNRPYYGFYYDKLIIHLRNQNRLNKPEFCSNKIYELMLDCWNLDPLYRPTFTQIVERIKNYINQKERELENSSNLNVNYVNYLVMNYYECKKINSIQQN